MIEPMTFEELKNCPKCEKPLIKKNGCFFLREVGQMPGMICDSCKALYESKEWHQALLNRAEVKRLEKILGNE